MSREVPSSDVLPLLGSTPWISREGLLPFVERSFRQHGDAFSVALGPASPIVLAHPEMVKHVLKTRRENFVKGKAYDGFRMLVGNGMVTSEGDVWSMHRRTAQPAFARARLETFVGQMARATRRILDRWRARPDRDAPVEVHHEMALITMEIVSEALFGVDGASDPREADAFADTLLFLSDRGNARVPIPMWVPTPANRALTRNLRLLDESVYGIIRRARERRTGSDTTLLRLMMDARDPETGAAFSEQELRDEVVTMFLAGHETTALTLTWAFHVLRRFPDVVATIREEAARVLTSDVITSADVAKLEFTSRVVEETLRLRPSVWAVARDVVDEDEIQGFRVPAGSMVMPSIYLVHRHPDFWEAPEEFRPERFEPLAVKRRHPFAYVPFSQGPRVCIGNTFAMIEGTLLLALLLRDCDMVAVDDDPVPMKVAITNRPERPIHMVPRLLA